MDYLRLNLAAITDSENRKSSNGWNSIALTRESNDTSPLTTQHFMSNERERFETYDQIGNRIPIPQVPPVTRERIPVLAYFAGCAVSAIFVICVVLIALYAIVVRERQVPRNHNNYQDRGITYLEKGDYDLAIAEYNETIRLNPDNAVAHNNRGLAYDNKGDYDRAIAEYSEAIRLKPDLALAYNNRGAAYSNKSNFDRAIADSTEAIRLKPDLALAYYNRGVAYLKKSDYDRAIADLTEAIRLKPDFADAYNNRGIAYSRKWMFRAAAADRAMYEKLNK